MRGTVAGEAVVSQAATPEYRDNHSRIFGERKPQRGKWIWDEVQQKLVPADEYHPPRAAKYAPVMVDRFMEGSVATDGTDIGSRAKRREYMRREGATDASDYKPGWGERVRSSKEAEARAATQKAVAELAKVDTRNLRNAVEALRKRK